jgi:2-isopropylmalate synthase
VISRRKCNLHSTQVVQEVADREARDISVKDITPAFRTKYLFGGSGYKGRLVLELFKISSEPSTVTDDGESDYGTVERTLFDGTVLVDGVLRAVREDCDSFLSAFLDAPQPPSLQRTSVCVGRIE